MVNDKMYCHGCNGHATCCTHIGTLIAARGKIGEPWEDLLNEFPYDARPDGTCEMLGDDGKCSVYHDRPMICNVEESRIIVEPQTPIEKWLEQQEKGCKELMADSGRFTKEEIDKLYTDEAKESYWAEKSVPENRN